MTTQQTGTVQSPRSRAASRKRRRMYLVLSSLAVLGLAVALVLTALGDSIRMFYDPTEVVERQIPAGETFRLGGLVEKGSLERGGDKLLYKFRVTDGNETMQVIYHGQVPDLFREGQGVVAEGHLDENGIFVANEVLAKHDENYMPKEVAESLKERGLWQHEGAPQ
ncbi:cytochrome c maturation protein CcmE [Emcibacter nanhaiensis]|uniref:Cytochrome c-type biogenesis protein CcmE n=1 Tax=Emcibacter nanhaiensis TaxID=1505037 RepID=A0A501PP58_9PROT|nr:cytochrome c maturation protein CcmE [Emcibacter nanhaiensis]TPD61576.1 cytochrome c maturation protein CcmE [Emcibacter nanhaiensis]